jgi:hypothetical protein
MTVAGLLGKIGSKAYATQIARLLKDDSYAVRGVAVKALGILGDRTCAPAIAELLGESATHRGRGTASDAPNEWMQRTPGREKEPNMRASAIAWIVAGICCGTSLGAATDPLAGKSPTLEAAPDRKERPTPTPEQRAEIQKWIAALSSPEYERREAASAALKKIGEEARPDLERCAASEDPEVAVRARQILASLDGTDRAGPRFGVVMVDMNTIELRVDEVIPDSPADKAGIRAGDRILRFGEREIRSFDELTDAVQTTPKGKPVAVRVERDGKDIDLEVTIGICLDARIVEE